MKTINVKTGLLKTMALGCAMSVMIACNEDSNEPMGKGDVEFEITDAPSDDAAVKGVIVTIADIKMDGQSVKGFTKQSIDLKAYQEGKTKILAGAQQIDAKTYSGLTLVLDHDKDASGASPGCYVLTQQGTKYKLKQSATGTQDVAVNKTWAATSNTKTNVVMDFDLRKAIASSDDPNVKYTFVSDASLQAAVRVVTRDKAGTIKGTYSEDQSSNADKIIVYAYKKGSFNASSETQAQGESKIYFSNAVSSSEVKQGLTGKTFTIALLESGEYELHFAAHEEDPATGRMKFKSMLQSETSVNGAIAGVITVQGGLDVNIVATIKHL